MFFYRYLYTYPQAKTIFVNRRQKQDLSIRESARFALSHFFGYHIEAVPRGDFIFCIVVYAAEFG